MLSRSLIIGYYIFDTVLTPNFCLLQDYANFDNPIYQNNGGNGHTNYEPDTVSVSTTGTNRSSALFFGDGKGDNNKRKWLIIGGAIILAAVVIIVVAAAVGATAG